MTTAKKFIYSKPYNGFPNDENIQLVEEKLSPINDGEVLFRAVYLSVDPYMRLFVERLTVGSQMIGEQLARVIDSKHKDYSVGQYNVINTGWRSHSIVKPGLDGTRIKPVKDYRGIPLSLALGTLGMPGATAYLGLTELLKPKTGEIVLVTAAAGAVGNVVGQVAKILGCKVIGCAGSPEKVNWLKQIGFDVVFNYKKDNLDQVLSEAAPSGIDCYFDNVGGEFANTVIRKHMAQFGRVAVCGGISGYNNTAPVKAELPYEEILRKCITIQGFIVGANFTPAQWTDAFDKMAAWIKEGKLHYREHITEGFDNMRKAFYELFTGDNFGKAIIKV